MSHRINMNKPCQNMSKYVKTGGKVEDFEGPDRSLQLRKLAESQERVAALRQKLQVLGDSGNMEAP